MEKKLEYSSLDFHFSGKKWTDPKESWLSPVDKRLSEGWGKAMSDGYFRYNLSAVRTKIIPGKYNFITQLNLKRGVERRKPDNIQSLNMPFDPNKFNFTKVKEGEILFEIHHGTKQLENGIIAEDIPKAGVSQGAVNSEKNQGRHLVMINISPLEYGHILLVPHVDSGFPQVVTFDAIQFALEFMLLSSHPGFRVGFNSLCALASVNHLHFHAWYVEHKLPIEYMDVKQVQGECYELLSYPVKAFVLQLHGSSVVTFARNVLKITNHLQRNEIAHNIILTRGATFKDSTQKTIRAYIYPRLPVYGVKFESEPVLFNVAVAELGGHLPCYYEAKFDEVTEEYIEERLTEVNLPPEQYEGIVRQVRDMFSET